MAGTDTLAVAKLVEGMVLGAQLPAGAAAGKDPVAYVALVSMEVGKLDPGAGAVE